MTTGKDAAMYVSYVGFTRWAPCWLFTSPRPASVGTSAPRALHSSVQVDCHASCSPHRSHLERGVR
eukprot:11177449-Lingulodinium_polyedra.AAC.1